MINEKEKIELRRELYKELDKYVNNEERRINKYINMHFDKVNKDMSFLMDVKNQETSLGDLIKSLDYEFFVTDPVNIETPSDIDLTYRCQNMLYIKSHDMLSGKRYRFRKGNYRLLLLLIPLED